VPHKTSLLRGITQFEGDPEGLWGWFFANKDLTRSIEILAERDDSGPASLQITLRKPTNGQIDLFAKSDVGAQGHGLVSSAPNLVFRMRLSTADSQDAGVEAKAWIEKDNVSTDSCEPLLGMGLFVTPGGYSIEEDARRYSKLNEVGRGEEVLAALQILEPRLRKLEISVNAGKPILTGDMGMGRLMPIAYMGQGMEALVSRLLALLQHPGGVVLIDEFENGLHHSVLKDVWRVIAEAARRANTQVFATTHSKECILAAHEAMDEVGADDFALRRLERRGDKIVEVVYEQDVLEAAFEADIEVR